MSISGGNLELLPVLALRDFPGLMEMAEDRPVKRVRIASSGNTPAMMDTADAEVDDFDDIYDSPGKPILHETEDTPNRVLPDPQPAPVQVTRGTIPGLGLLGPAPSQDAEPPGEKVSPTPVLSAPSDASVADGTDIHQNTEDRAVIRSYTSVPSSEQSREPEIPADVGAVNTSSSEQTLHGVPIGNSVDDHGGDQAGGSVHGPDLTQEPSALAGLNERAHSSNDGFKANGNHVSSERDSEFVQAGISNRDDHDAEWQLDSSAEESSATPSSSDGSSSSDEESDADGYNLLSAEEQARILMAGDGGSDDEGATKSGKPGTNEFLRTANEKPEEVIPKPSIEVTPDMRIVDLGEVENIVENHVLIKAKITGETQVLDSGSVLCLEDRTVIGAVAEPLGRVEQPLYSVAFSNREEIDKSPLSKGTKVFYVEKHSSFVFTQRLKIMKGSDASNIHDEEVGADEIEFSDDEAEAEYKRQRKQERAAKRGATSGANGFARQTGRTDSMPTSGTLPYNGGAIKYDDNDDDDDMYTPLARPSNLHEMMGSRAPPVERGGFRGRPDRTRGDRGRGNRGRNDHGSRARGGARGRRGIHSNRGVPGSQSRTGDDPTAGHSQMEPEPTNTYPVAPNNGQHHEVAPSLLHGSPRIYSPQTYSSTPHPTYAQQSHGWLPSPPEPSYQYSQPAQQLPTPQQQQGPSTARGTLPPGAFVNPAFFRNQQPAAWAQQQQYSQYQQYNDSNQQQYSQYQQQYPQYQLPSQAPNAAQNVYRAPPAPQYPGYWNNGPQSPSVAFEGGRQSRMSPESDAAFRAAQEKLDLLRNLSPDARSP